MMARIRGSITLSFSCRSLHDDRDMFPAQVLLSAFRLPGGEKNVDHGSLSAWMSPPASFSPETQDRCIEPSEWWMWRFFSKEYAGNPQELIGREFPHLGQGYKAVLARKSDIFTEYDGYVPAASSMTPPSGT